MEEVLRQELLAKTKRAVDANDWRAIVPLWQPWVERGDAEAEYQLAYNCLWSTMCDDDATYHEMEELLRRAAAKNHADAIWFLATREKGARETSPEFERELLRAGQLGSIHAQRVLCVCYETGDWSGPKDLGEAARWYRLAAEKGEAESQFHLGYMLLLGEGVPKNLDEGLMWLERPRHRKSFWPSRGSWTVTRTGIAAFQSTLQRLSNGAAARKSTTDSIRWAQVDRIRSKAAPLSLLLITYGLLRV